MADTYVALDDRAKRRGPVKVRTTTFGLFISSWLHQYLLCIIILFFLSHTRTKAATCSNCFTQSRAVYYTNSEETDHGISDRTDFILSKQAFGKMAQTKDSAATLLAGGVVDIEYRHFTLHEILFCDKNMTFEIAEASNYPNYLAFVIWYQQGMRDVIAMQLCETHNQVCKLLDRTHGAIWGLCHLPEVILSIKMLLSDGEERDEERVMTMKYESWA
ncbi:expansin-like B1 [Aristolochia californica]|uniref:expansin-like B1 n=1 Tax=Aristolochia californica TaxID=171875 RepID=UPI0035E0B385